jgi:cyclophilin family peptidyl-prolyl cis-trans isomerase
MVDTGLEMHRMAPKENPDVTDLLITVARHYAIGRLMPLVHQEFAPVDGGDQYERALPIIKQLAESETQDGELHLWGFLCAFVTSDFDLAETYFKTAQELKAMDALAKSMGEEPSAQSYFSRQLFETIEQYSDAIGKYRALWSREAAIRKAEAAANDLPRVKLTTTKGEITLELFENEAPQTVANFITLVKQGFYDDSPFHRVVPRFMAQGGAKTADGTGGPGYRIRCECYRPDYRHHFRGSLSMAHAGRDTGSSQFFLTFVPTTHLDGGHTVFGRVIEGLEVLGHLQQRAPEFDYLPTPDRILKAQVIRDRGHEYSFERLPE